MIRVRAATTSDAEEIAAIYAPVVAGTTISFEETIPTAAEMATRIKEISCVYPYLVAERDRRVVGYAYASQHRARTAYRRSVEVTAYVAENARGTGVGRALYESLFPLLADGDFHMAFAGIALPNPASVGLHKAMGFEQIGVFREIGYKFGKWINVGWWQRQI